MKLSKPLAILGITALFSMEAQAQFSVSGLGSAIPATGTGGGGNPPLVMPPNPGSSSVTVLDPVTSIDSVLIEGLTHTYVGDLQATLMDPAGVEHLLWIQPGTSGNFTGGLYVFVETGGIQMPDSGDIGAGTYNQSFVAPGFGGGLWNSGDSNIFNTPMSSISGSAGAWTLKIYDLFGGDVGAFTGWKLNGNGAGLGDNTGDATCFGDGTGAACTCSGFGAPGAGCMNTSGTGASLTATGDAYVSADTYTLTVAGAPPNTPGIFFQGNVLVSLPAGAGVLCSNATVRFPVVFTDQSGGASDTGFGAFADKGQTLSYQFWYRDSQNGCSSGAFNLSGAWIVTWY